MKELVMLACCLTACGCALGTDDAMLNVRGEDDTVRKASGGARGLDDDESDGTLMGVLGGAHGWNRMALCNMSLAGGAAARCRAALWRPRWAVARASCLGDRNLTHVSVLRGSSPAVCTSPPGSGSLEARRVMAQFVHPQWTARWPGFDLVLLLLDRPYYHVDQPANLSVARLHIAKYEFWMESVFAEESRALQAAETAALARADHATKLALEHRPWLLKTPLLTLLVTVILPLVLLLVLFLIIIFGTNTPVKVPYTNIKDESAAVITPWQTHPHNGNNVKCHQYVRLQLNQ